MDKDEQVVHYCSFSKNALCVRSVCEGIEYDPRSYCHSICANPHHVCNKSTCKKYVKKGKEQDKCTICVSTQNCRLIRRFGSEQLNDDTLIIKGKWKDAYNAITNMPTTEKGDYDHKQVKKKSGENADERTKKLLRKLALHLNDDRLSRIISLGGSEICPRCVCRVCKCNQIKETVENRIEKPEKTKTHKKILPPRTKKIKISQQISKTSSDQFKTPEMYKREDHMQYNEKEEYIFSDFTESEDEMQLEEKEVQKKEREYEDKTEKNRAILEQMPNSGFIENIENRNQRPKTEKEIQKYKRTKIESNKPASKFFGEQSDKDKKVQNLRESREESIQNSFNENIHDKKIVKEKNPNANKGKKVQYNFESKLVDKQSNENKKVHSLKKSSEENIRNSSDEIIQDKEEANKRNPNKNPNKGEKVRDKTNDSDSIENTQNKNHRSNTEKEIQNYNRTKIESNKPASKFLDKQFDEDKMVHSLKNSSGENIQNSFDGNIRDEKEVKEKNRNTNKGEKVQDKWKDDFTSSDTDTGNYSSGLDEKTAQSEMPKRAETENSVHGKGPNSNKMERLAGGMTPTESFNQNEKIIEENIPRQNIDEGRENFQEEAHQANVTANRKSDEFQSQPGSNMIDDNLNENIEKNQRPSQSYNSETKRTEEKVDDYNSNNKGDNSELVEKQFSTDKSATFEDSIPVSDSTFSKKLVTKTQESPQKEVFNGAGYNKKATDMTEDDNDESFGDWYRDFSNSESDFKPQIKNVQQSIRNSSAAQKSKSNENPNNKRTPSVSTPEHRTDSAELDELIAWQSITLGELISHEISSLSDDDDTSKEALSDHQKKKFLDDDEDSIFAPYADICEFEDKRDSDNIPKTPTNREYNGNVIEGSFSYASSYSGEVDSLLYGKSINPKLSKVEVVAFPPEKLTRTQKPGKSCKPPRYQRTLLIVKPEAVRYKDVILRAINKEGMDIIDQCFVQLTPEQVSEIYTENYGSSYFALFVQQMSSSPILVLSIGGFNSIEKWNEIIGEEKMIPSSWFYPSSVKRRFGIHKDVYDAMRLSDDFERAQCEIRYFFPLGIVEPIIVDSFEVLDYCEKFINPTLLKGLNNLVKVRPSDPLMYLAEWILINDPFQPHFQENEVALAPK